MPEQNAVNTNYAFDLFISYSNDPDYQLSRKIESFLEGFHKLKTTGDIKLSPLAVCRDGSDFSLHALKKQAEKNNENINFVNNVLDEYLSQSEYLLVLCSKNSALSEYVQFEINWFLQNRGPDAILLAVTEGDNINAEAKDIFAESIIEQRLHTKIFYDLRGFKKESKQWQKVRNEEEELTNIAAFLNHETSGSILPLWQKEETRKLKRQKLFLTGTAIVFLVLAIFSFFQSVIANKQKNNAKNQLAINYRSYSRVALSNNDVLSYLNYVAACFKITSDKNLSPELLIASKPFLPTTILKNFLNVNSLIMGIAHSPDGNFIAIETWNRSIEIWNTGSGKKIGEIDNLQYEISKMSFNAAETIFAVSGEAGSQVWKISNNNSNDFSIREVISFSGQSVLSTDDTKIIAADNNSSLKIWDINREKVLKIIKHVQKITQLKISADNKYFLGYSDEPDGYTVYIWDVNTGKQVSPPLNHIENVAFAEFNFNGTRIISEDRKGFIYVWNTVTGKPVCPPVKTTTDDPKVTISPDGNVLAFCDKNIIYLRQLAAGKSLSKLVATSGNEINTIEFSADGKKVLAQYFRKDKDNFILWDLNTHLPLLNEVPATKAVFSPDCKQILSLGNDSSARLWNTSDGLEIGTPMKHLSKVVDVTFSADSRKFLTSSENGLCYVWDAATATSLSIPVMHKGVSAPIIQFNTANGNCFFTTNDSTVKLWQIFDKITEDDTVSETPNVDSAFYSPDGNYILAACADNSIHIWDAQHLNRQEKHLTQNCHIVDIVFNPDGSKLATVGIDSLTCIWDIKTGSLINKIKHDYLPVKLMYSPDGSKILAVGEQKMSLWKASDEKFVVKTFDFKDYSGNWRKTITNCQFSPDGNSILVTNGSIYLLLVNIKDESPSYTVLGLNENILNIESLGNEKKALIDTSIKPFKEDEQPVTYASFNLDGSKIACVTGDIVEIMTKNGVPLAIHLQNPNWVNRVIFSNDGMEILEIYDGLSSRLWKADDDNPLSTVLYHNRQQDYYVASYPEQQYLNTTFFNADNTMILTTSDDGVIRVWDGKNGKPIAQPIQYNGFGVKNVSFSPNGKTILSLYEDGKFFLWNACNASKIETMVSDITKVKSVVFNSIGTKLLIAKEDGLLRQVDIGADLDMPSALYDLQLKATTGTSLNTETGEIYCLSPKQWTDSKNKYMAEAKKHYKKCNYQEYNYWLWLYNQEKD